MTKSRKNERLGNEGRTARERERERGQESGGAHQRRSGGQPITVIFPLGWAPVSSYLVALNNQKLPGTRGGGWAPQIRGPGKEAGDSLIMARSPRQRAEELCSGWGAAAVV